jgi:hypothetical protein
MTNIENEILLVRNALGKDADPLLTYIAPSLDTLVAEFESDADIAKLEIPTTSLRKSAEKHFTQAVVRYNALIDRHEAGDAEELPPFTTFYAWFAKQGMTEYAHQWAMILMVGGCSDCGTHSH